MAELQFSHTKMGFIIDLRKPPHAGHPPHPPQQKKKTSSSCLRKNSRLLNGIFCAKAESSEGRRAEGTARVGEGVCRLGFVWMAGRDKERQP